MNERRQRRWGPTRRRYAVEFDVGDHVVEAREDECTRFRRVESRRTYRITVAAGGACGAGTGVGGRVLGLEEDSIRLPSMSNFTLRSRVSVSSFQGSKSSESESKRFCKILIEAVMLGGLLRLRFARGTWLLNHPLIEDGRQVTK
jgi:hypothetical protein